jgi:folate-binding protein YgfZ
MKDNYITILEKKTLISITGKDSKNFLQNFITNDIQLNNSNNTIYAALLTPQGKLSFHFFIIDHDKEKIIVIDTKQSEDFIKKVNFFKLNLEVDLKKIDQKIILYIHSDSFLKKNNLETKNGSTLQKDKIIIFTDPRMNSIGAYAVIEKTSLNPFLKENSFTLESNTTYDDHLNELGLVDNVLLKIKDQFFSLECNLKELNAISFTKGCYLGQENTARMNMKDKLSRRVLPVKKISGDLNENDEIFFKDDNIGKIISTSPLFALVKVKNINEFKTKDLITNHQSKLKIVLPNWLKT